MHAVRLRRKAILMQDAHAGDGHLGHENRHGVDGAAQFRLEMNPPVTSALFGPMEHGDILCAVADRWYGLRKYLMNFCGNIKEE
jgi:hypothetical protein